MFVYPFTVEKYDHFLVCNDMRPQVCLHIKSAYSTIMETVQFK